MLAAPNGVGTGRLASVGGLPNAELLRTGEADVGLFQSGTEQLADVGAATALSEVFSDAAMGIAPRSTYRRAG